MQLAAKQTIILGPPGCGKTTELLRLVEEQLEKGVAPDRIAFISFTRKAVNEARSRAVDRFGFSHDELKYFRTVHSLMFELNHHSRKDVVALEHYVEIGALLGIDFANSRVDESTGLPSGNSEGDTHLFISSLARSRCVSLEEQWRECEIPDLDYRAVERTVQAVDLYKKTHGLVDFTDMLEIYAADGRPLDIDVAFVDEAQDLSMLQWQALYVLLGNCPVAYIAGDDDQAIYRWSGADVTSFLELSGERRLLSQSYRCPKRIHKLANIIAGKITPRIEKPWVSRDEEGRVVRVNDLAAFDLDKLEGTTLLLARNTYLLSDFQEQLRKRGIPFFTAHGQHSVPPTRARAIIAWEKLQRGHSMPASEIKLIYDFLRVGVGVTRGFKALTKMDSRGTYNDADLRATFGLLAQGKWFDALDGIPGKDIAYYRSILRGGRSLTDTPPVSVNTVHGIKGGEADNVVLSPDMAWKSYREMEKNPADEARVAYVAVTRTRKNLFLLSPRTRNFYPYIS